MTQKSFKKITTIVIGVATIVVDQITTIVVGIATIVVGVVIIVVDCDNCEHSDNCDHITSSWVIILQ